MVLSEDIKGVTVYVVEGEKLDRACLFPGSPSREEEKRLWAPSAIVQSRKVQYQGKAHLPAMTLLFKLRRFKCAYLI